MVNPHELIKKFDPKIWLDRDKHLVHNIKLTNEEVCFLSAIISTHIYITEKDYNVTYTETSCTMTPKGE